MTSFFIMENLESEADWKILLERRSVWVRSAQVKIHAFENLGKWCLRILDLQHSFKRGMSCMERVLSADMDTSGYSDPVISWIGSNGWSIQKVMALITGELEGLSGRGISCHERGQDAWNTFSPFHLDRLARLKKAPAKWSKRDAIRAIANGQYNFFRCDGVYTDDYSDDAERNYQKGQIQNWREFIEGVMSGSGWSVYQDQNSLVHVCCYHFNLNSLEFNVNGVHIEQES